MHENPLHRSSAQRLGKAAVQRHGYAVGRPDDVDPSAELRQLALRVERIGLRSNPELVADDKQQVISRLEELAGYLESVA